MTRIATRRDTPFADPAARTAAGVLGMRLFLLSLGILFAASLIGYVSIRVASALDGPGRGPLDLPPLPRALWLSTLVLVASSGTMQWALASARRGDSVTLQRAMAVTWRLGALFLVIQVLCWIQWLAPMREALDGATRRFVLTAFYVLTGLHALHVVGGLVPMTVVARRARAGRYDAARHAGVTYVAMYWHFLDAVWLVLFAALMIGM